MRSTWLKAKNPLDTESPDTGNKEAASPGITVRKRGIISRARQTIGVRLWMLAAFAAALVVALGLSAYLLAKPPPHSPTVDEFNHAVETYLQKRPPGPTVANQAYAAIQKSLVLVRSFGKDTSKDATYSLGTGIVVESTGTILTSLHVVRGAKTIKVTFADGFESNASVTNIQMSNDLAVLKPDVAPEELQPATLASSAGLQPGDEVVAVGNPFGIPGSVSSGVVSGLGRTMQEPGLNVELKNLIQFDAAVNPGNSGGPLLNRNGEVVGIVTALLNPTKENFFIGIGFAVTIESAQGALGIPPW